MPHLPTHRATTRSPLPLVTAAEARVLRLAVSGPGFARVRRGVYVEAAAAARLAPWQRYALRVHAFALAHPDAVLCLESAAVLLGLPLFGETRDIHVFDPDRTASRRFGDVCVHTSTDAREIVRVDGILCTSPADAVVDLARVLPPAQALAVVDAAISPRQGGMLVVDDLRERAASQGSLGASLDSRGSGHTRIRAPNRPAKASAAPSSAGAASKTRCCRPSSATRG
ncbi:hypothetical protein [Microbacterium sp. B24]|uniref:hypothetical protein n=1 Tax=Microbacterium sp. B24 TaxID=95616 RepID=UPI00040421FA|nr:hypothetical protein [Microbacterium sp. B24]